jgi:hypothetical protein
MNRNVGVSSFGSVEDLIRTSLGGSFVDTNPPKKEESPIETEEKNPDSSDSEDISNPSIQRLKNFDPSTYKKKIPEDFQEQKEEIQKEEIPEKRENLSSTINNYYPFYRDVEEVFECKVTIEGTSSNSSARLLLESETWNIIFQGKIKKDGMCSIPIKKLSLFPIGTIGKATLEVIVDDILFTPWENPFRIEESKKVEVEVFKRRPK